MADLGGLSSAVFADIAKEVGKEVVKSISEYLREVVFKSRYGNLDFVFTVQLKFAEIIELDKASIVEDIVRELGGKSKGSGLYQIKHGDTELIVHVGYVLAEDWLGDVLVSYNENMEEMSSRGPYISEVKIDIIPLARTDIANVIRDTCLFILSMLKNVSNKLDVKLEEAIFLRVYGDSKDDLEKLRRKLEEIIKDSKDVVGIGNRVRLRLEETVNKPFLKVILERESLIPFINILVKVIAKRWFI